MAWSAEQTASLVKILQPPSGTTVAQWVALARGESSHNPRAVNSQFTGLWQVGYKLHAGKYGLSTIPQVAQQQLMEPGVNFKVAKQLFEENRGRLRDIPGGDWMPTWEASARPSAEDNRIAGAVGGLTSGDSDIPVIGGAIDAANDAFEAAEDTVGLLRQGIEAIVDAGRWISDRDNWVRIAMFVTGSALVLVGVSIFARPVLEPLAKAAL